MKDFAWDRTSPIRAQPPDRARVFFMCRGHSRRWGPGASLCAGEVSLGYYAGIGPIAGPVNHEDAPDTTIVLDATDSPGAIGMAFCIGKNAENTGKPASPGVTIFF